MIKNMEPVHHVKTKAGMNTKELLEEYEQCGVMGAGRIGKAYRVMRKMFKEKNKIFLGIAGCMVPGGMKETIHQILSSGKINVFVTTGAMLTHDTIEAIGEKHYKGNAYANDAELNEKGIDRMWDSFMKNEVYIKLEKFVKENQKEIEKAESVGEILTILGKKLPENSILNICYRKKIELFCPAFEDCGIALMIWGLGIRPKTDMLKDLDKMMKIAWESKQNAIIYVGGGVPKNYIQQALQLANPAKYAVQITTDFPHWGGSSGAELREGISWGKLAKNAEYANVYCDATIALPLLWSSVQEK